MKKIFKIKKSSIIGCKRPMAEMEIPRKHKLTHIAERAFYANSVTKKVAIPGNIRTIGYSAFEGAKSLQQVSLAAAGMVIAKDRAFKKCKTLSEIENMSIIISYGDEAFKDCESLVSCDINPYLVDFGKRCFEGCKKITRATLPILHSTIPQRAFYECESLSRVELSPDLETISDKAFWGCIALDEVTFTETLKLIGAAAFEDCYSLSKVALGGNLKKIEKNAFRNCRSLAEVELAPNVNKKIVIERGAFKGCTELRKLTVPKCKISLSPAVFGNCGLSAESPLNVYCEDEKTAAKISSKLKALVKKGFVNVVFADTETAENEEPDESNETLLPETQEETVSENVTEDEPKKEEEPKAEPENVEEHSLEDIFEEK